MISVSSASAPCRARASAAAASASRARSPSRSRACRRTSSFATWKPKISTIRSARRAGRRRSGGRRSRSGSRGSRGGRRGGRRTRRSGRGEPPAHERQLPAVRLQRVARADLGGELRQLLFVAGDRLVELGATPTSERDEPSSTARACTSLRYRVNASARARASASAIVAGPTTGLPSMSPPIHEPKRSGGGASGMRVRHSSSSSVAASIRLCSKNQRPFRISSLIRSRSCRTSSVCQRSVTSSAIRSSIAWRSVGRRRGSSSSYSCSAMRMWERSTVRRVASVGCAVRTRRIEVSRARSRSAPASVVNASSSDSREMRPLRASSRRRRRRCSCSARFASWK